MCAGGGSPGAASVGARATAAAAARERPLPRPRPPLPPRRPPRPRLLPGLPLSSVSSRADGAGSASSLPLSSARWRSALGPSASLPARPASGAGGSAAPPLPSPPSPPGAASGGCRGVREKPGMRASRSTSAARATSPPSTSWMKTVSVGGPSPRAPLGRRRTCARRGERVCR
eukprot:170914-Chlamydomonas_euryale.AAC.2